MGLYSDWLKCWVLLGVSLACWTLPIAVRHRPLQGVLLLTAACSSGAILPVTARAIREEQFDRVTRIQEQEIFAGQKAIETQAILLGTRQKLLPQSELPPVELPQGNRVTPPVTPGVTKGNQGNPEDQALYQEILNLRAAGWKQSKIVKDFLGFKGKNYQAGKAYYEDLLQRFSLYN